MLSYTTVEEEKVERDELRRLLLSLDVSNRSLRRDECGAWSIMGRKGHANMWGPRGGWLLCVAAGTPRQWSALKRGLFFCQVTQDGDAEGCFRLVELPTPEQAAAIRKALGLRRKRAAHAAGFVFSSAAE